MSISLRRTGRLLRFDLANSLLRLKGLFFLLPFFLFWYPVLRFTGARLADWLQQPDGLLLASGFYTRAELQTLFVSHPPALSIFYVTALATLPLFAVLAGLDQYSSDLGRGWYRLLATRCSRAEIFAAGYLVALCLLGGALTLTTAAATGIALARADYAPLLVLGYAGQIWLILMGYSAALIGFMAVVSVSCRSPLASLFLGLFGYLFVLLLGAVLNTAVPQAPVFHYLLPGALKPLMLELHSAVLPLLLACLGAYTLVYTGTAWMLFRRARL